MSSPINASPAGVAPPSCQIDPFKIRIGETNTANWKITNGGVCVAHFKLAETSHYNSVKISSGPAHGIAEADGVTDLTYRPDPGFKGKDAFAVSVEGYFKGKKGRPEAGTGVVRVSFEQSSASTALACTEHLRPDDNVTRRVRFAQGF